MIQQAHDLLTVQEVAEKLRVHEMTVRRMIASGDLPVVNVGRRALRIEKAELSRYLGKDDTDMMLSTPTMVGSVNDLHRMLVGEMHWEVAILPLKLNLTKTDFGLAFGLPEEILTGKLKKDGTPEKIHIRFIINKRPWDTHLLRPEMRTLPPGFTLIHFSLRSETYNFTTFFMKYYSQRYKHLPTREARWQLYNSVRACAIWEGFEEKIRLQRQGIQAFAVPEVYERLMEGRQLFDEYQTLPKEINKRLWKRRRGTEDEKLLADIQFGQLLQREKDRLNEQMQILREPSLPQLPPLPQNILPFKLLEEPPAEFMEGAD